MIALAVTALIVLMFAGLPLYLVISGGTLLAFNRTRPDDPSLFLEMLRMADAPTLLAIPLFTFAGFVLARSRAPSRLVNLSDTFLGWMPGGLSIVAVVSCALLTAFTGASGVTIIALGGLLMPSLLERGYGARFATGLLTTSGSRGLLFPPSLPLILYAIVTKTSVDRLFLASVIPGLLGVAAMAAYCLYRGKNVPRTPRRSLKDALGVLKKSWAEIPLPILVLGGIYGGWFTVTDAACIACLYVIAVEVFILREIRPLKDLPGILVDSMVLVGSILVILAAALGFTSFLVDRRIPMHLLEWTRQYIHSPLAFLLFLNGLLLVVGCIMDIFSAIIIVVPLIHPVAMELGIDPFHLGVIFLTNLEIGYSTPPVGLNLFIAGKTFRKSILEIYRSTFPFLLIMFAVLFLVTFFPGLTRVLR